MGIFGNIKAALGAENGRTPEAELKRLKEEYARFKVRASREFDSYEKKIVHLEEQSELQLRLNVKLEEEKEKLIVEHDRLRGENAVLEDRYRDLLSRTPYGGARSASSSAAMNSFEKNQLAKAKERAYDLESSNDSWLLSYSDFMTLLLTFFVLLFAMSSMDMARYKQFTRNISETFGGGISNDTKPEVAFQKRTVDGPIIQPISSPSGELDILKENILKTFKDTNLGESFFVDVKRTGVEVTLRDKITFVAGDSIMLPSTREMLGKFAELLRANEKYDVIVEGHTDNIPIKSGKYPSNWELSTSRATNVVKYLVEEEGLASERFSAAGYGEHRPLADNSTETGRAANRRVVIKLVTRQSAISTPIPQ